VGGGYFGDIFEGKHRGQVVALKLLRKADSSDNLLFYREALIWRSLKHKFILHFFGIYELGMGTVSRLFLVSPYMKNGTLIRWRQKENPPVAEIQLRILEVAQGMEYIHSEGAVHGDLRGENVLLDDDLHVKIADFGLTRVLNATNTRSGALHANFAAPELFECLSDDDVPARTHNSDVYAFGCLYYEV
ncbi:kinase-like domain-containing protein, partial [Amanita rubescens]